MDISRALQKLSKRYPGRRVLITGATSGLGEALAMEFASAGWRVAVTGRSIEKASRAGEGVSASGTGESSVEWPGCTDQQCGYRWYRPV
jgi:NAD(P)-dependent dehydrogenase (short-subunit alcohol dehydrogenase family)